LRHIGGDEFDLPAACRLLSLDDNIDMSTTRPYEYRDAATLLADFWEQVEAVLKEKGVE
jgi:hypothetical protein